MSANDSQKRIQDSVSEMMLDLDRKQLRKMQATMHRCAATCCEDQSSSTDGVQNCIERCQTPVQRAQEVIESEMTSLQNRLTRCGQDCHDRIKDTIPPDATPADQPRYQLKMDDCIAKCADEHVRLVPKIRANIDNALRRLAS